METEENRKQVFLGYHSPWKSLARFPHSHRRDEKSHGKVESPKAGLPTFPRHDWDMDH
jgi:hypothetical protein